MFRTKIYALQIKVEILVSFLLFQTVFFNVIRDTNVYLFRKVRIFIFSSFFFLFSNELWFFSESYIVLFQLHKSTRIVHVDIVLL